MKEKSIRIILKPKITQTLKKMLFSDDKNAQQVHNICYR